VDAYVYFVRERSLLEAIASSLTELFSPQIISDRMQGMLRSYDFISADALAYFGKRPPLAQRDSQFALDYVLSHANSPDAQQSALSALEFKCDVLWAMLDALYYAYVSPAYVPYGAFIPKPQDSP
jgi:coenzyme PQQ biosynthesis protein C